MAAVIHQHQAGNSAGQSTSWQVKGSSSGLQVAVCSTEQCNEVP